MKRFARLIENIALGLFVNGSYAIMIGDVSISNVFIVFGSIYVMAITIFLVED